MSVIAIEYTKYYYGVHKVVQIFGPIFVAAGLARILQLLSEPAPGNKVLYYSLIATSLGICAIQIHSNLNFSSRTIQAVQSLHQKGITAAESQIFSRIRPGTNVLLNDMSWSPADRYSKTNWIHYLVRQQGSDLVMGATGADPYRGAYFINDNVDTMRWADRIDWIAQAANSQAQQPLVVYVGARLHTAGRTELIDLRDKRLPAVTLGTGWHEPEPSLIWTEGAFTLDVLGQTSFEGEAVIEMDLGLFSPAPNSTISVLRNGNEIMKLAAVSQAIQLPVVDGYQVFEVRPNWSVQSPADIGLSEDNRKLFASVTSITIKHQSKQSEGSVHAPQ